MTKAKEALDWLYDVNGTIHEPNYCETIRKALELLDRLQTLPIGNSIEVCSEPAKFPNDDIVKKWTLTGERRKVK